jgi:hypothetical protein
MTEYTVSTVECLSGECAPLATVLVIGGAVGDLVTRVSTGRTGIPAKDELFVFRAGVKGNLAAARPVAPEALSISVRESLGKSAFRDQLGAVYQRAAAGLRP